MSRRAWLVVLAVLAGAVLLRVLLLELRPPHHDEGVNGWFVERMRERGYYRYDPGNYHGPTYFYLLAAVREVAGFGLWQLRLPGALIGALACLVPLIVRRQLGATRTVAACALLASSPTLVYFARYAIHETLLAALGVVVAVAVLRWAADGRARWLIVAGAALAGMVATKETTIIFLAAAGPWLVAEVAVESWRARRLTVLGRAWRWSWRVPATAAAIALVMAAIHVVFFTGFFQLPGSTARALERSGEAYAIWSRTGTSEGGHEKSWSYYLQLGARYELALYALALLGTIHGWRERAVRGPGVVGFGMLAIYSAIAYKMPWLPASWLALLALPAGHGALVLADALARVARRRDRTAAALVLALALVPALAITVRSSFVRPASPREDLAYVHTSPAYRELLALIERGAATRGRDALKVAIAHPAKWPLAWALLPYPATAWKVTGDEDVIIIAADRVGKTEPRLRGAYYRARYPLRDRTIGAYVYFRRELYAPWLDGGKTGAGAPFVVVEALRAARR